MKRAGEILPFFVFGQVESIQHQLPFHKSSIFAAQFN
jgi:hypothetical protein